MNRELLERMHEEATGLDPKRGADRVSRAEEIVSRLNLDEDEFAFANDPKEISDGWKNGRKWSKGAQYGNRICLGYTRKGSAGRVTNAVFLDLLVNVADTDY